MNSENINYIKPSLDLIDDYLVMVNNPDISRFISKKSKIYTYQEEKEYIENKINNKAMMYSMLEKNTKAFIGNIEIMNLTDSSCEIGIVITESMQNKHYGKEALSTLINYIFNELNLPEVTLVVFSNNERAIHCYEKLGFIRYKVVKNVKVEDNKQIDDIYMRLKKVK